MDAQSVPFSFLRISLFVRAYVQRVRIIVLDNNTINFVALPHSQVYRILIKETLEFDIYKWDKKVSRALI